MVTVKTCSGTPEINPHLTSMEGHVGGSVQHPVAGNLSVMHAGAFVGLLCGCPEHVTSAL